MTDITIPREIVEQALEALEQVKHMAWSEDTPAGRTLLAALRDRLAQPEQALVIDCPRCGHCCPQSKESA